MRLLSNAIGVLLSVCAATTWAQPGIAQQPQGATAQRSGTGGSGALLGDYDSRYRGSGLAGAEILEQANALGVERSAANAKSIRRLLASNVTSVERTSLIRMLARQYGAGDPTGLNNQILSDLKAQMLSGDADVARTATYAYSRLGYFPDQERMLLAAKERGLLDNDAYFGELAHMLAFAPPRDQRALARTLRDSRNDYASQIVAMLAGNDAMRAKIAKETQEDLGSYLVEVEPQFAMGVGQFDLADSVRYSSWLYAVAVLQAGRGQSTSDFIMTRLGDQRTDARKIMGYLASEHGPDLIAQVRDRSRFNPMLVRISEYSMQHPQSREMAEVVGLVRTRLTQ